MITPGFKVAFILAAFHFLSLPSWRASIVDEDGDGMSDVWQFIYNIADDDRDLDPDEDGRPNWLEALFGTDPNHFGLYDETFSQPNTVVQGIHPCVSWQWIVGIPYSIEASEDMELWETVWGPEVGSGFVGVVLDNFDVGADRKQYFRLRVEQPADGDGDGLNAYEEALLGTDDTKPDSDDDGMPDLWEFQNGLDPSDMSDATLDRDGDGYENKLEFDQGSGAQDWAEVPSPAISAQVRLRFFSATIFPGDCDILEDNILGAWAENSEFLNPDPLWEFFDCMLSYEEAVDMGDVTDLSSEFVLDQMLTTGFSSFSKGWSEDRSLTASSIGQAEFRGKTSLGSVGLPSVQWSEIRLVSNFGVPSSVTRTFLKVTEIYSIATGAWEVEDVDEVALTIGKGLLISSGTIVMEPDGGDAEWRRMSLFLISPTNISPARDMAPPRYRKIGLNGRPLGDGKPQSDGETDLPSEETYVDVFSRNLHYDTSLIYIPLGASDLPLQVSLSWAGELWNERHGFRPQERKDRPFGSGWTSSVSSYIEMFKDLSDLENVMTVTVVDEAGRSWQFGSIAGNEFFPMPGSPSDAKVYLNKLTKITGTKFEFARKYGNTLTYEVIYPTLSIESDRIDQTGKHLYQYARLAKVKDRYGNQLNYAYQDDSLIPSSISDPKRPGQAITIRKNQDGLIEEIEDPLERVFEFSYSLQPGMPPGAVSQVQRLDQILRPDGTTINFDYEFVAGVDSNPLRIFEGKPADPYHFDLSSITAPEGNQHRFEYEADTSREAAIKFTLNHTLSAEAGAELLSDYMQPFADWGTDIGKGHLVYMPSSRPRVLSRVILPDKTPGQTEGEIAFAWESGVVFSFTENGDIVLLDASRQSVSSRSATVTDAEGHETTFTFGGIQAFNPSALSLRPLPSDPGSESVMLAYSTMDVVHPAGSGVETYTYNALAGYALASVIDLSGNSTLYDYENVLDPGWWSGYVSSPKISEL